MKRTVVASIFILALIVGGLSLMGCSDRGGGAAGVDLVPPPIDIADDIPKVIGNEDNKGIVGDGSGGGGGGGGDGGGGDNTGGNGVGDTATPVTCYDLSSYTEMPNVAGGATILNSGGVAEDVTDRFSLASNSLTAFADRPTIEKKPLSLGQTGRVEIAPTNVLRLGQTGRVEIAPTNVLRLGQTGRVDIRDNTSSVETTINADACENKINEIYDSDFAISDWKTGKVIYSKDLGLAATIDDAEVERRLKIEKIEDCSTIKLEEVKCFVLDKKTDGTDTADDTHAVDVIRPDRAEELGDRAKNGFNGLFNRSSTGTTPSLGSVPGHGPVLQVPAKRFIDAKKAISAILGVKPVDPVNPALVQGSRSISNSVVNETVVKEILRNVLPAESIKAEQVRGKDIINR